MAINWRFLVYPKQRASPGSSVLCPGSGHPDVATVLGLLSPVNLDAAIERLSLPDRIRGYGPVKEKAVQEAKVRHAQLAADRVSPPPAPRQIAAE